MLTSNNVLLRILARLCQLKTVALAAKYGIFQLGSCSVRDVKCGLCQLKTVALAAKYGIFQLGSCSVRDVKCGILALSGTLYYDL